VIEMRKDWLVWCCWMCSNLSVWLCCSQPAVEAPASLQPCPWCYSWTSS